MNWLHRNIMRWLQSSNSMGPGGLLKGSEGGDELLSTLASTDQPHNINIVPIGNGFLLCRRVYNSQGPDKITATYAKGAEELGPMLIAELATARITK